MSDNVTVAMIAGSAVVISAICVLGAAIYAHIATNKRLLFVETKLEKIETKLESIDVRTEVIISKSVQINSTLQLIQNDLKEFFNQLAKIKAHIKLD
jgi:peptidoglycan hydrolase CwlO-like protein